MGNADPPTAEFRNLQAVKAFCRDVADVFKVNQVAADVVYAYPIKKEKPSPTHEKWLREKVHNRVELLHEELAAQGIPKTMLTPLVVDSDKESIHVDFSVKDM